MADLSRLTTHDDNITVTITMDAASDQEAGFGTMAFLADKAGGTDFGAARYAEYSTNAEVQADSQVSATVKTMAAAVFSQSPAPERLIIAHVDTGALESYADGLAALKAKTTDFYGVAIESRADADIVSITGAVETDGFLFCVCQSDDTTLLTAGYPAGLAAVENLEYSALVWHDDDSEWAAECFLANRLVFDPDEGSAPWDAPISAVANHTTQLTQSQKDALDGNAVNYGLPYGTSDYFIDAGVNTSGRPIYEILTAAWFETRLVERVSALKVQLSARGHKITVTKDGQRRIGAVIEELFEQATDGESPHFVPGQYVLTYEPITSADLTAQKLRFSGQAQYAVGARLFGFNFHFGRDPVVEAEA